MDLFFATTTCRQERLLQEDITSAIINGTKQTSLPYIVNNIQKLLSMAYCTTQKELYSALKAIKQEKAKNPQAAKKIKAMLSKIYKVSSEGKHRLDYFVQIWKNIMYTMFGKGRERAKKAVAEMAPMLTARAQSIGTKMSRMMFRELQKLGDAVYESSTKIATINRIRIRQSAPTARCPANARC